MNYQIAITITAAQSFTQMVNTAQLKLKEHLEDAELRINKFANEETAPLQELLKTAQDLPGIILELRLLARKIVASRVTVRDKEVLLHNTALLLMDAIDIDACFNELMDDSLESSDEMLYAQVNDLLLVGESICSCECCCDDCGLYAEN